MVLGQCWEHAELTVHLQSEARRNSQCCATVLLQCLLWVFTEESPQQPSVKINLLRIASVYTSSASLEHSH